MYQKLYTYHWKLVCYFQAQIEGLSLEFESQYFEAGLITRYAVVEKTQKGDFK